MLGAGRYAEALSVLSLWHDDASLGLEESQRLEDLLGQLAGTVIYSQKDLLLPPHIVAPGETLPSIATPLQVPWQLLAKINGVTDPSQLVPGEHLKVVRGPFDAVISVSRRRMSLQVGGNYAGSFPVVLGRQIYDRIGQSVAVIDIRRPGAVQEPMGIAAQVAYAPVAGPKSIILGEGLAIEGVEDPSLVNDSASASSVIVSLRDLEDIADILGPGSQVLVRK
jgi:LysM repeat protein